MEKINKLVEISRECLLRLRELFKVEWPRYMASYNTIDSYIDWYKRNPELDFLKVYSLNGNWEEDGTFLAARHRIIFVGTLLESKEKLKVILKLWTYSRDSYIGCVTEELKEPIWEVVQDFGDFGVNRTFLYFMSKEDALKIEYEVPEGIFLKPLEKANAARINELWPHQHVGSIKFVETLIEYNDSLGAFTEDGEMVAWCLKMEVGTLSLLQVEEKHYRKGYGTLITKALSKIFADSGHDVIATIVDKNSKSLSMFEKCGFQRLAATYWIYKIDD